MRWSIKIARIVGIEVRIHITFLLFLAWIGSYYSNGGAPAATEGALFVLALFIWNVKTLPELYNCD
jgi:stage IV sporulation protein FB